MRQLATSTLHYDLLYLKISLSIFLIFINAKYNVDIHFPCDVHSHTFTWIYLVATSREAGGHQGRKGVTYLTHCVNHCHGGSWTDLCSLHPPHSDPKGGHSIDWLLSEWRFLWISRCSLFFYLANLAPLIFITCFTITSTIVSSSSTVHSKATGSLVLLFRGLLDQVDGEKRFWFQRPQGKGLKLSPGEGLSSLSQSSSVVIPSYWDLAPFDNIKYKTDIFIAPSSSYI